MDDEIIVVRNTEDLLNEMEGTEVEMEMEIDTRPLIDRIGDKNWKKRLQAYEQLRNEMKNASSDEVTNYSEFAPWLVKMTSDTNASSLDAGLDTTLQFIESCSEKVYSPYLDKLFQNAIDKTFGNRPNTQSKGKAILQKVIEKTDPTACCNYLLTKLTDKKVKIPPTCLDTIREGMILFGAKPYPIKEIIKTIGPIFNGSNGPARDAAMNLLLEIHRWIGQPPIQSLLDSMRSAQKTEFEKLIYERRNDVAQPTLWLCKDRPLPGNTVDDNKAVTTVTGSSIPLTSSIIPGVDPREYVDEIDLLKKLKMTEYFKLIVNEKWSEQLKGLQLIIDAIGPVPKIKSSAHQSEDITYEIVQVCKGFLRQGHVQLQVTALRVVALLADGLRSEFSSIIRPVTQMILQKCKEKRLVSDVQATIRCILMYCLNFDHLLEDIIEALVNKKSPNHAKLGMMDIVIRTLQEMPLKVSSDSLKPLLEALFTIAEDSDAKVRENCTVCCAEIYSLIKIRGKAAQDANKLMNGMEQNNLKFFKKVQSMRETLLTQRIQVLDGKVIASDAVEKEYVVNNGVDDLSTTGGNSRSDGVIKPKKVVAVGSDTASVSTSKSLTKLPSKSSTMVAKKTGNPLKKSQTMTKGTGKEVDDDEVVDEVVMSPEEAKVALEVLNIDGWSTTFEALITSNKWQDKVEALGILEAKIQEHHLGGSCSAALLTYIGGVTNGYKIPNASILKAVIQLFAASARNVGSVKYNRSAGGELLQQFGDKLSDKKLKETVESLLTALCEAISPSFVVKRMKGVMEKTKSPLSHQYYLDWVKGSVKEFRCSAFPVPFMTTFCHMELENKAPGVRTSAVEVLGAFYHQIGPRYLSVALTEEMSPQVRTLLETEFGRVGHDPTAASGDASRHADPAEVTIPRLDIIAALDKNILTQLNTVEGKTSWQGRKTAMEAIIAVCERSGHYIEATKATSELVKALKVRVNDTQANLKPLAVAAIGHVIASLELDSAVKYLRGVGAGLMTGIADNKKPMRDATIAALQIAVTANKSPLTEPSSAESELPLAEPALMAVLIPSITESLMNPVGRLELLVWMILHVDSLAKIESCQDLTVPLVTCMQDKTAAVRAAAEQLLTSLMSKSIVTRPGLDKATRDLAPAVKRALQAAIDRLMLAFGSEQRQLQQQKLLQLEHDSSGSPGVSLEEVPLSPGTLSEPSTSTTMKGRCLSKSPAGHHKSSTMGRHDGEDGAEGNETSGPSSPTTGVGRSITPSKKSAGHNVRSSIVHSTEVSVDSTKKTVPRSTSPAAAQVKSAGKGLHSPAGSVDTSQLGNPMSKWLLKKTNKSKRLEEFYKLNWPQPPEDPGETEFHVLRSVWEPLVTSDLTYLLFPSNNYGMALNQEAFVPGMNELSTQFDCPYILQHVDLILRWCGYVLGLRESAGGLTRLLQLITDVFELIRNYSTRTSSDMVLHDAEVSSILPHIIDKSGHNSERHRQAFKQVIIAAGEVIPPNKINNYLIQGLTSKNKKSRVVCVEEIQRVVDTAGMVSLGKVGIREVGSFLDAKDNDVNGRSACLDLVYDLYVGLGAQDLSKLFKLLGDISARSASMIEERVKQKQRLLQPVPKLMQMNAKKSILPTISSMGNEVLVEGSQVLMYDVEDSSRSLEGGVTAAGLRPPVLASEGMSRGEVKPSDSSKVEAHEVLESFTRPSATSKEVLVPTATSSSDGVDHEEELLLLQSLTNPSGLMDHTNEDNRILLQEIDAIMASTPLRMDGNNRDAANSFSPELLPSKSSSLEPPPSVSQPTDLLQRSHSVRTSLVGSVSKECGELETILIDICKKIDAFLRIKPSSEGTSSLQNEVIYDEAKDYVKLLTALLNGEWSQEGLSSEDEDLLGVYSEQLARRMVKCINKSFDVQFLTTLSYRNGLNSTSDPPHPESSSGNPDLMSRSSSKNSDLMNGNRGDIMDVDVSMLSIALSTLYLILKRPSMVQAFTEAMLFDIFYECLNRIQDPRLVISPTSSHPIPHETAEQLVRAFNTIVLQLSQQYLQRSTVLCVLLRVIFLCIPPAGEFQHRGLTPLPSHSVRPTSRLIIKVLTDETEEDEPYQRSSFHCKDLLISLHQFFTKHPQRVGDDTPFRSAKTILNEVIKYRGGNAVLKLFEECGITQEAYVVELTRKLGNMYPHSVDATSDGIADRKGGLSHTLHAQLVAIFDNITLAKDKTSAIRELHKLKKSHTEDGLDVNLYLQKVSPALRRFVMNTLNKLDAPSVGMNGLMSSSNGNGMENMGSGNVAHTSFQTSTVSTSTPLSTTLPTTLRKSNSLRNEDWENTTPSQHNHQKSVPSTPTSSQLLKSNFVHPPLSTSKFSRTPYEVSVPPPTTSSNSSSSINLGSFDASAIANQAQSSANEAMRILEGIKSRSSNFKQQHRYTPSIHETTTSVRDSGSVPPVTGQPTMLKRRTNSASNMSINPEEETMGHPISSSSRLYSGGSAGASSPFAKIRDSLTTLSASLETISSTGSFYETTPRAQRLKNMELK